jgi:hypothetical protein
MPSDKYLFTLTLHRMATEGDRYSQGRSATVSRNYRASDREMYREALQEMFLWGNKTKGLAFRLHQFIDQGVSIPPSNVPNPASSL